MLGYKDEDITYSKAVAIHISLSWVALVSWVIEFWPHFLGKKISFLALIECGVIFLFFYRNVRQAEPSKISWELNPAEKLCKKDKLSCLHRRLRQFPIFTLLFVALVSWVIEFWPHFLGKKISFLALIECDVTFLFFYRNVRQAEPSKISWSL